MRLCSGLSHQFGIDDQHRLHLGLAVLEHERAGAVGVARGVEIFVLGEVGRLDGVVLLGPDLAHHAPVGDLLRQDRIRPVGRHVDREVIDLGDRLDRRDHCLEVGALHADAIEGEDDVGGGERRSVVKLDALAELEPPDLRRDLLPFGRESRLDLEVLAPPDQGFVDVAHEGEQERLVPRVGVHRVDVAIIGETEGLGRCRQCRTDYENRGECRRDQPLAHQCLPTGASHRDARRPPLWRVENMRTGFAVNRDWPIVRQNKPTGEESTPQANYGPRRPAHLRKTNKDPLPSQYSCKIDQRDCSEERAFVAVAPFDRFTSILWRSS